MCSSHRQAHNKAHSENRSTTTNARDNCALSTPTRRTTSLNNVLQRHKRHQASTKVDTPFPAMTAAVRVHCCQANGCVSHRSKRHQRCWDTQRNDQLIGRTVNVLSSLPTALHPSLAPSLPSTTPEIIWPFPRCHEQEATQRGNVD